MTHLYKNNKKNKPTSSKERVFQKLSFLFFFYIQHVKDKQKQQKTNKIKSRV